jgi:hypothetical protein
MRQSIQFIYTIVESSRMNEINFKKLGISKNTIRYNKNKSKILCKFTGENSDFYDIPLYTKENIKKILKNPDWKIT